ncbi:MAG: recombinase family protein [Phormidium tanganyikae FI6-MK23]|jgi:DNA invertase Pin-like site-specific DNA recombinase|nr:recombinase family protein [Phormidium tanganyikae FI6-MK23]
MRIVGYARVSKQDEEKNPNALAQQVDRLKTHGCTEVFREEASATKGARPIFADVLRLVQAKEVDRVVVTRIDRLGRTRELSTVYQTFINAKVDLLVLDQKIDLNSTAGRLLAGVLADVAIFEGELISERSKHGWEYLRKRQEAMNPPFGYKKSDILDQIELADGKTVSTRRHELDHELDHDKGLLCMLPTSEVIEEGETKTKVLSTSDWTKETLEKWTKENTLSRADAARDLVDIYLITKSIRKTIRTFNLKYGLLKYSNARVTHAGFENEGIFQRSPSGFAIWITNPVLRGHLRYFLESEEEYRKRNKGKKLEERDERKHKIIYGTHLEQRLITEEEFRQIETIIKQNRESHGFQSSKQLHPLSGLIKCAVCGSNYSYNKAGKEKTRTERDYYYYYCPKSNLRTCESFQIMGVTNYLRVEVVEEKILNAVKNEAMRFQEKAHKPTEEKENPEILEKQHQIQDLQKSKNISGIPEVIERLQSEIEMLRGEKKLERISPEQKGKILSALNDDRFWQELSEDQKFFIYRDLVARVEVKPSDDQPMALTENQLKKRKRSVNWDINVVLNGERDIKDKDQVIMSPDAVWGGERPTWDKLPSKVLSEAVELFLVTHPDVEPLEIRPLREFADFMRGLQQGTQKLD